MEQIYRKKEVVRFFLGKDILLSPRTLDPITNEQLDKYHTRLLSKINSTDFLVLNGEINDLLDKIDLFDISWIELDKSLVLFEKNRNNKLYKTFLDHLVSQPQKEEEKPQNDIKIVFSYKGESQKRSIQDFVGFFNARYSFFEKIMCGRMGLQNITSINRIKNKKDRDNVSLIAMVSEKRTTKNNNLMLTVEDPTGSIKVLVNKNRPDLFDTARDITLDEVIGIVGVNGDNIVFANNIVWPDITTTKPLVKHDREVYSIFLSDLHVGSKNFLAEDFKKFLKWINCELGNETQRSIASKVKYIFVVGDLVDGCGIYPGQDNELDIKDIYQQYVECANLLGKIPRHINLIICPGNHDAMRIAEPQPELYRDFAEPLYKLPNITMVSNPSIVNICSSDNFPGFDVLLYHGYSFDFFVANVDTIRNNGGYDRADLIMRYLLQRRHLAPTHTSNLYLPDPKTDPLIIERAPDFFISGHLHKSIVANYRNITLVCGSCWQSKTTFQEKVGHNPEPSRVPIVNLKTRAVKILRFGK